LIFQKEDWMTDETKTGADVAGTPKDARPIKLACRNVWKLFGSNAASFIRERDGKASMADVAAAGLVGAVRAVDLEIRQGEIFIIMGLSGSGKSTLVRCMSRLVEPTHGKVEFEGKDLLKISDAALIELRRHRMGMVFQNFALLPHLNVLDNIAFPLSIQGQDRPTREARAREVIELVGLRGREHFYPRGDKTRNLVPRRAVLGARPADPPRNAGRVDAAANHAAQDHRLHHP
jgi:glycine betaine/proline transport system ATP-binding protein